MTKSSSAPAPTPSDLDESAAMTVADALKIILANSYAIYLKNEEPTGTSPGHISGTITCPTSRRPRYSLPLTRSQSAPGRRQYLRYDRSAISLAIKRSRTTTRIS